MVLQKKNNNGNSILRHYTAKIRHTTHQAIYSQKHAEIRRRNESFAEKLVSPSPPPPPNNKPSFECSQCEKVYTIKKCLTEHIQYKHTVAPFKFKCPKCKKTFAQKGDLNMQIKIVNNDGGKKRFKCDKCPYRTNRTNRKIDFEDHKNTHDKSDGSEWC